MSYWDSYYRQSRVPWDPGSYDRHLAYVLEEFSIKPCRVVDVGCGDGVFARLAKGKYIEYFGIDISKEALETAKKYGVVKRIDIDKEDVLWVWGR